MSRTNPIRTFDAVAPAANAAEFYRRFGHEPLIVRDFYPAEHPVRKLTLEAIGSLLGDIEIPVYTTGAGDFAHVPAADVIRGAEGSGPPYNIVDFSVSGHALGELFEPPWFLDRNWFLTPEAGRAGSEKCLVLSPANAFTPLHMDSYAMQGWMFLIAGRKHWRLFPPQRAEALYDAATQEFREPSPDEPFTRFEGSIGAGDLLWFPAGWVHSVRTDAMSFGVGGSALNDFQIEDHMFWWLWERGHGIAGKMDLKRVIEAIPDQMYSGPEGRARAARALAACKAWEQAHG